MGQSGSQPVVPVGPIPHLHRRAHTLPHEPVRHAPKVLPSLTESPRLRSTDNGAILHSGGTISGRRPGHQEIKPTHGHNMHMGVYRSRSAGAAGEFNDFRSRERDPLHRSYTNFDLRHENGLKRFGSEPDLRIEEEQKKPRCNNRHFRKKYRAPPPPAVDHHDGSSPDSSERNAKVEPQKKLRLFKTRHETKNSSSHVTESRIPQYRRIDNEHPVLERRNKPPVRDRHAHLKYPDSKDMIQSSASMKKEENLIQPTNQDNRKRPDRVSGCRAKTSKYTEQIEMWKTPLLSRNFRHSERFRKEESDIPQMRRERSFDATLLSEERENKSPKDPFTTRMKETNEKNQTSPLALYSKPVRKSLPSLLNNNDEKDEFRAELKKATTRIRNDLMGKINNNVNVNKTSHNEKLNAKKPNATKHTTTPSKVNESSPIVKSTKQIKDETNQKIANSRRPLTRVNDNRNSKIKSNLTQNNVNNISKNGRAMLDRGQASGKESTPEHSPIRKKEPIFDISPKEKLTTAPSKQFYFGMIDPVPAKAKDNLKDFPGLGSPIIEEINDFHLIEKKLLGYREEDDEFEKFNARLKADLKFRNISSESAVSSDGSECEGSDGSLGIALRLRPTLPKKQPKVPSFSPAAAWRQLASLDAHLAAESQQLAVDTKVLGGPSESSPRSDQSADKSGDSGISGDHTHSDQRLDSPNRNHTDTTNETWTPQQDLGDSSSDGAGHPDGLRLVGDGLVTYSPRGQPFSLSLPREPQDKGKQMQNSFNSLQKLRKSVSGALGAALGSRRFDLEHEPMLHEPEQNWFLTKSAPNSLSNPLFFQPAKKITQEDDIKEETPPPSEKEEASGSWRPGTSYLSWGGHVMYLPPAPAVSSSHRQPISLLGPIDRPVRSKSSGELETLARAARSRLGGALAQEMRERERSSSPVMARALPARVDSTNTNRKAADSSRSRGKRFTFQSTVRQLERRRLAEKLSKEADLKEQQRKTELEAMRRVEEEFQRKRAREKANIRQQLRLVSGTGSMPMSNNCKGRDEPDGAAFRDSPALIRPREVQDRQRHSNASSETSGRSKSTTPIRNAEISRQYRDWSPRTHDHPPACARMPIANTHTNGKLEIEAFSGSPRSDNYRLEFARGVPRSPRTPRPPRMIKAPHSPSSSGSDMSLTQPMRIRDSKEPSPDNSVIIPTLRPTGPARPAVVIH